MNSIIGKTILGYKVTKRIGTGGFGDVYQVERNNIVGNVVRALKVIELPKESQYLEILNAIGGSRDRADKYFQRELDRVVDEIRVFSMLSAKDNHHIVIYHENDVVEVSKHRYRIYILMEMLIPLDQWLQENDLSYKQGMEISLSIAKAIKLCHDNNIMHRDIKLNNVFVNEDGKFKLGDFGVSKRLDSISRAHTIKGTPTYIAPEVYMGKEKYNKSVDIYSLGILIYYIFNKRRYPFFPDHPKDFYSNDIENAFYKRINYEKLKNPVSGDNDISKIILKALDKPENRYNNIDDYIRDMEELYNKVSDDRLILKCEDYTVDDIEQETELNATNINKDNSISYQEYTLRTMSIGMLHGKRRHVAGVILLAIIIAGIVFAVGTSKDSKKTEGVIETTVKATTNIQTTVPEMTVTETTIIPTTVPETTVTETTIIPTTEEKTTAKKHKKKTKEKITTKAQETYRQNNNSYTRSNNSSNSNSSGDSNSNSSGGDSYDFGFENVY